MRDADRVWQLNQNAPAQTRFHERLGGPTRRLRRAANDFRGVFPAEGAAAVSAPPAVRVDNDLTASKSSVTLFNAQASCL